MADNESPANDAESQLAGMLLNQHFGSPRDPAHRFYRIGGIGDETGKTRRAITDTMNPEDADHTAKNAD